MVTWESVVEFATTLPGVEESTGEGKPELSIHGKGFVRLQAEDHSLVIMCTPSEKTMMLYSGDPAISTTPNYDGNAAILAHLDQYDEVDHELQELITEAWRIALARANGAAE